MKTEEVKITSMSQEAIKYRNMRRPEVDRLFTFKEMALKKKPRKAEKLDAKARQLWREVITISNSL